MNDPSEMERGERDKNQTKQKAKPLVPLFRELSEQSVRLGSAGEGGAGPPRVEWALSQEEPRFPKGYIDSQKC